MASYLGSDWSRQARHELMMKLREVAQRDASEDLRRWVLGEVLEYARRLLEWVEESPCPHCGEPDPMPLYTETAQPEDEVEADG